MIFAFTGISKSEYATIITKRSCIRQIIAANAELIWNLIAMYTSMRRTATTVAVIALSLKPALTSALTESVESHSTGDEPVKLTVSSVPFIETIVPSTEASSAVLSSSVHV